jgi:FtsH-binding integral membrane protein
VTPFDRSSLPYIMITAAIVLLIAAVVNLWFR